VAPTVISMPPPIAIPRLAQFLRRDIEANLVEVHDEVDRSIVVVRGDGTFAPGSASLLSDREDLMGRIGDAIAKVPGRVLVTGHTDNQPLSRSARYPSNFVLSDERAQTVAGILSTHQVAADRITAEGDADSHPVKDNATPAGRAANRRVEITVFTRQFPAPAGPAS
jgi:type VI secretion system protein ImpK